MTRLVSILTVILCALLLFSPAGVQAAAGKSGALKKESVHARAGQTVNTDFFSVTIPAGWFMPDPVNRRPPALSAAFANQKTGIAITFNVLEVPVSAKDLASRTVLDMKKSGLKTGNVQQVKNFYKVPISGKANGEAWFASNGKICTATVILGEKMNKKLVNDFLKVFKPVDRSLFPASF